MYVALGGDRATLEAARADVERRLGAWLARKRGYHEQVVCSDDFVTELQFFVGRIVVEQCVNVGLVGLDKAVARAIAPLDPAAHERPTSPGTCCARCGRTRAPGDAFCTQCGHPRPPPGAGP